MSDDLVVPEVAPTAIPDNDVSDLVAQLNPRKRDNNGRNHAKPRTPNQVAYVDAIDNNSLIWAIGPAGSGKTRMAVAKAVEAFETKKVNKIILSRPAVGSEDLGAVPGGNEEKVAHYLVPLYEFLNEFMGTDKFKKNKDNGNIEFVAVGHMRGRNLDNAFVIVDEAQNCTEDQLKTLVTRIGKGSTMVITGDPTQSDLPAKKPSGLIPMLHHTVGVLEEGQVSGIAVIKLEETDIQRHPIVAGYVRQFKRASEETTGQKIPKMPEIPGAKRPNGHAANGNSQLHSVPNA